MQVPAMRLARACAKVRRSTGHDKQGCGVVVMVVVVVVCQTRTHGEQSASATKQHAPDPSTRTSAHKRTNNLFETMSKATRIHSHTASPVISSGATQQTEK